MKLHEYSLLIVGAGFSGCVIAERVASVTGGRVLIIDKRDHIGGNAHDYYDKHGVLVHRYGPHVFHTNSTRIADYLSQFTRWWPYEHRVRGWVDEDFVPLPVNFKTMEMIFGTKEGLRLNKLLADEFSAGMNVPILQLRQSCSADVRKLADVIYEKVFLHYTIKQWGMLPDELAASVTARVPVRLSYDDRYFQDAFQNMPKEGYYNLFERMLANPLIEVRINTSYQEVVNTEKFNRLVWTGPIDEFFAYRHGPLPYRSLRFELKTTYQPELIQGAGQENYPTPADLHPYTRITEFRHLTGQSELEATTRAYEYPERYHADVNEPYYPIPTAENREIYRKYQLDASQLKSVVFTGRLADYSYYNMDQAIGSALSCFEKEIIQ